MCEKEEITENFIFKYNTTIILTFTFPDMDHNLNAVLVNEWSCLVILFLKKV